MKRTCVALFLASLLMESVPSTSAEVLRYEFGGQIDTVSSATLSVTSSIYVGSPFSVTFRIDTGTLVDQDPGYANGNFWAFTDANQVSILLGGYQFETWSDAEARATIQTWVPSQQVAFFGHEFVSPQFQYVGSATQLQP